MSKCNNNISHKKTLKLKIKNKAIKDSAHFMIEIQDYLRDFLFAFLLRTTVDEEIDTTLICAHSTMLPEPGAG